MRSGDMTIDPEEFEAGEDVTKRVRKSDNPSIVVSARLDAKLAETLLTFAERRGVSLSEAVRVLIQERCTPPPVLAEFSAGISIGSLIVQLT